MIITDIVPKRKKLSAIYIDGEFALKLDTETVLISKFSTGSEITDEELKKLIEKSNEKRAKEKALWLISYRDHSKKELQDKLKRMYNKKAPQPRKNVFNGERFEFDKKLFTDLEFLLDFAKEIYNYGGILGEKINGKGTVIFADDKIIPPIRQKIEKRGLKIATVEEIQNKMQ